MTPVAVSFGVVTETKSTAAFVFGLPHTVYVANAFTLPEIERSQLPALTSTARAGATAPMQRAVRAASEQRVTPLFIVSSLPGGQNPLRR